MSEKEMLEYFAERAERLPETERALLMGYARGLKDAQTMQAAQAAANPQASAD